MPWIWSDEHPEGKGKDKGKEKGKGKGKHKSKGDHHSDYSTEHLFQEGFLGGKPPHVFYGVHDVDTVAVKVAIKPSLYELEGLVLERLVSADTALQGVVPIVHPAYPTPHGDVMLMRCGSRGTLKRALPQIRAAEMLDVKAFLALVSSLAEGLSSLHQVQIIHCHPNLNNIVLHYDEDASRAELWLIDFHDARMLDLPDYWYSTGPGGPEVGCHADFHDGNFSIKTDSWCLAQFAALLWSWVARAWFSPSNPATLDEEMPLRDMLQQCLHADPGSRPSAAEIAVAASNALAAFQTRVQDVLLTLTLSLAVESAAVSPPSEGAAHALSWIWSHERPKGKGKHKGKDKGKGKGKHKSKGDRHIGFSTEHLIQEGYLGAGGFSHVFHGVYNVDAIFVKVAIKPSLSELERAILERLASADTALQGVVPIVHPAYPTPHGDVALLRCGSLGTLACALPRLRAAEMLDVKAFLALVSSLAKGLSSLHQLQIIHCDPNLNNLVLHCDEEASRAELWLIDFGDSRMLDLPDYWYSTGPGGPEIGCHADIDSGHLSTKTDSWCLAQFAALLWSWIARAWFSPSNPATLDEEMPLRDMLQQCLQTDPGSRPSAAEIAVAASRELVTFETSAQDVLLILTQSLAVEPADVSTPSEGAAHVLAVEPASSSVTNTEGCIVG